MIGGRILLLVSALSMCEPPEDDDTPVVTEDPEPPPPLPPPPAQRLDPDLPPIAAPQLDGAYALTWRQDRADGPRIEEPEIARTSPQCWGRWGWDFRSDGGLAVSSETLCPAPEAIEGGSGHGVCRAELATQVRWHRGGFAIAAPVGAQSRFVYLSREGESGTSFRTGTVRCNVNVGAVQATLEDIVPGTAPNRPRSVTLVLADGARWHLEAIDDPEVNHANVIIERSRQR